MIYWSFFGTNSELDLTQMTVEAFPGRRCSYYGCYERQARARFYTFSTVSCAWTEPVGFVHASTLSALCHVPGLNR